MSQMDEELVYGLFRILFQPSGTDDFSVFFISHGLHDN